MSQDSVWAARMRGVGAGSGERPIPLICRNLAQAGGHAADVHSEQPQKEFQFPASWVQPFFFRAQLCRMQMRPQVMMSAAGQCVSPQNDAFADR